MRAVNLIWKGLKITVAMLFLFGAIIMGYTAHQIIEYNRSRPSIISKESTVFKADSEIMLSDMATVKNSSDAVITSAEWSDGGHDNITIMSDGSSLIVGDKKGKLFVMIEANGERQSISKELILTIE